MVSYAIFIILMLTLHTVFFVCCPSLHLYGYFVKCNLKLKAGLLFLTSWWILGEEGSQKILKIYRIEP